jgi:hypothetical protein
MVIPVLTAVSKFADFPENQKKNKSIITLNYYYKLFYIIYFE